jgi:hypothetical protein
MPKLEQETIQPCIRSHQKAPEVIRSLQTILRSTPEVIRRLQKYARSQHGSQHCCFISLCISSSCSPKNQVNRLQLRCSFRLSVAFVTVIQSKRIQTIPNAFQSNPNSVQLIPNDVQTLPNDIQTNLVFYTDLAVNSFLLIT